MNSYYDLLKNILENGDCSDDRTGTGKISLFGEQMRFDLTKGFPLLTGKHTPFKLIASELLWILSGSTNNEDLRRLSGNDKSTIWEKWCDGYGSLGPIYGRQWRSWTVPGYDYGTSSEDTIDQIAELISGLKNRPFSRRHIVSAWNVADLPDEAVSPQENVRSFKMALAPCHCLFQFYVRKLSREEREKAFGQTIISNSDDERFRHACLDDMNVPKYGLTCQLYQRSADMFLGVPFNIAFYALLTHMIAHVINMVPERLIVTFGDCHIYQNHVDQVKELLRRNHAAYPLPTLKINRKISDIDGFTMNDLEVVGYKSHPAIKAPVSI